jgi:hypothetical protein
MGTDMIDPAARTQEIKNRLDAVSARLHKLVSEAGLYLADPRNTKTEVLECKTASPTGGAPSSAASSPRSCLTVDRSRPHGPSDWKSCVNVAYDIFQ